MNDLGKALTTEYAQRMDRETPWNEYPRPLMKRDSFICLNGRWDITVTKRGEAVYSGSILVPFPVESELSGVGRRIGRGDVMHYRRSFTLDGGAVGGRLLLHFGAVDQVCEVRLNGKTVARHEGGYLPFSADVTDAIRDGENELTVVAEDGLDRAYPYGKQRQKRGGMWYTPVSGIWQTVWLERVPENYIRKLKITSDMRSATVTVIGAVGRKTLRLEDGEVYEFDGDSITVTPKRPECWSPETPRLYGFTVECGEDKVESYFALREIGVEEVDGIPRLTLNGRPYLFNGLLDQGYFPDGIYLPATSEGYADDITRMKALGFNTLRKHIKIEPEIFYHLCDRLGMVVFQDMVNNSGYSFVFDTALPTVGMKRISDRLLHPSRRSRKIFTDHMMATVEQLDSYPSVLYYTVFNEGWGQFNADRMYRLLKAAVPDKIVDATSGWFTRHESDVNSHHVYFKRIKLTGKHGGRPTVISEFGGYSYRVKGHLFGDKNYGYALYDTGEDFEEAFVRLYKDEVKEAVKAGASALVYTQVADVEDETNGLLTYDRRVIKLRAEVTLPVMKELSELVSAP